MAQSFREQGGAATMDPSALRRWLTSRLLNRQMAERKGPPEPFPRRLEYFHQLDDPYSFLAAQCIGPLLAQYDLQVDWHLVPGPSGANLPEPDLLPALAREDAASVAPYYGLICEALVRPDDAMLARAQRVFTAVGAAAKVEAAELLSSAVLTGNMAALEAQAFRHGEATAKDTAACLEKGDARRKALHHYAGGMFYYGGEWYWGVDRLYHLERRLQEEGAQRHGRSGTLFPRPDIRCGPLSADNTLTLEFYASLRSPYTALIFDTAVAWAQQVGVRMDLRPVLPMVMRGVPATRDKGFYIFADAAREARALGAPLGSFYDPIGEPVRQCYSLLPLADSEHKRVELMSSFLQAAFREGKNIGRKRVLRRVVERAGLPWAAAARILGQPGWEQELEANRQAMYHFNCWGVPSFRLCDSDGVTIATAWGQDRFWFIAEKAQETLQHRGD